MTNRHVGDKTGRLSPGEVAVALGVSPRTIARMADRGELHPITLPSGHRRYDRAEIEALAKPVEAKR